LPPWRPREVPGRTLQALASHLGVALPIEARAETPITGVTLDSRMVQPGDLYAAVAGASVHGADFAADARAAGAVAALTDHSGRDRVRAAGLPAYAVESPRVVLGDVAAWVYGDPSAHLDVIGVTGTNGKTTTAYLLDAGLRAAGRTTGLIGTIETRIGPERVPSVRTTPEAPDLQAMLAVMRERSVRSVAMEVSSHALTLRRVDGTVYAVGIFTNLSPEHLDFHHDLEAYFEAKARLFTPELVRVGVVNVDDEFGARLAREADVPLVSVSPGGGADAEWRVRAQTTTAAGSRFRLEGPAGTALDAATRLSGAFNVDNAALAIVALTTLGIDPEVAARGVASLAEVPGRMQRVDAGQEFVAFVDFAHTPDALQRLLGSVRQLTHGRVILVFGCGGDRDTQKRPEMGAIAAREADLVVLTSDNPRSEDPMDILAAVRAGATRPGGRAELAVIADRRAAIERAVLVAAPGDAVVVAGKGHEQGQEIAGVVHPFDDAEVLLSAIRSRA
jgi:UDP-N-acetylmuramoyl-L-alanyl-D-glutamate--2,6-diaminopimelate ligase